MNKKSKFLLLFTLSVTSVYFAEVISGSFKYPFYDIWGYFGVIPIYGLHTIILLYLIKLKTKDNVISFRVIYFAGILFGLYEAYLTKVLWTGLSDDAFIILNIAVMDFIVLVFFWHPIFSFILPTIIFEALVAKDSTVWNGISQKMRNILLRKRNIIVIFILIGFILSLNSPNIETALISSGGTIIPLILLYMIIYRLSLHNTYTLTEILPTKKEFIICCILLGLYYIGMGLVLLPEELTLQNQLTIWILYIVFIFIFYHNLIRNESLSQETTLHISIYNLSKVLILVTIVGAVAAAAWYLLGIRDVMMVIFWISWIVIGFALFVVNLLKKNVKNI